MKLSEVSGSEKIKLSQLNKPVVSKPIGNFETVLQTSLKKIGVGLGDVYGPPTEFLNQATAGLLRPTVKAITGFELPEATSMPAKISQNLAGIGGFSLGGPGRIISNVSKRVFPSLVSRTGIKGLGARGVQRSIEGLLGGLSTQIGEEFSPAQRIGTGVAGAVAGPVLGPAVETVASKVMPPAMNFIQRMARRKVFPFFSSKPLRKELQDIPLQKRKLEEGIEKEFGSVTPFISGEGKIGKNIEEVSKLKKSRTETVSAFKQKSFQRKEKSIKDLATIKKETEELAVLGEREANEAFEAKHSKFVEAFTEKLGRSKSSMTNENFSDILNASAKEYGAELVPGTPGNIMKSMADSQKRLSTKNMVRLYKPDEVQALSKNILNSLPDKKSKSVFYDHFLGSISKRVPDLAKAKSDYKPIFDLAEKAEAFKKANIKRMSKPNFSDTLLKEAQETEKQLGVQITGRATTIAVKRGEIANSLRTDINDLNQIKDKELNEIYERISKFSREKPQLIHEARNKIEELRAKFEGKKNFLEGEIGKRKWRKRIATILTGYVLSRRLLGDVSRAANIPQE